jgi:hypothetical protein
MIVIAKDLRRGCGFYSDSIRLSSDVNSLQCLDVLGASGVHAWTMALKVRYTFNHTSLRECSGSSMNVMCMYWPTCVIGNIHAVYMRTGFRVVDNKLVINSSRR